MSYYIIKKEVAQKDSWKSLSEQAIVNRILYYYVQPARLKILQYLALLQVSRCCFPTVSLCYLRHYLYFLLKMCQASHTCLSKLLIKFRHNSCAVYSFRFYLLRIGRVTPLLHCEIMQHFTLSILFSTYNLLRSH